MVIEKIEPEYWFSGLRIKTFQLLIYGEDLEDVSVETTIPCTMLDLSTKTDDRHLLINIVLDEELKAGTYTLLFVRDDESKSIDYEIKSRKERTRSVPSISSHDVVYLLIPDRFARGDNKHLISDDERNNPNTWHGGNIAGMTATIDYLAEMGYTAIWHTPVFKGSEYHGYAITNFYEVDSHFGCREDYVKFVSKAHSRELKVVKDIVLNHCSIEHPWMKHPPLDDWFNGSKNEYERTNYKVTTVLDPYASSKDKRQTICGWFTDKMPDLNFKNPHVCTYFLQMSIWWIETFGVDAFRVDTYPYVDMESMINWQNRLGEEYPGFSIIAETWMPEVAYTSQIQKKVQSKLSDKCSFIVMDFAYQKRLEHYLGRNLLYDKDAQLYHHFVYDFLYNDAANTLAFLDNHDLPRWASEVKGKKKLKQALALLLTSPRIPQIYYGTEFMLTGNGKSDGEYRLDTFDYMKSYENHLHDDVAKYLRQLLLWRKKSNAICKGTMKHYIPQKGVYVYFREYADEKVMVISNGTSHMASIELKNYAEDLGNYEFGIDVITKRKLPLTEDTMQIKGNTVYIIEL